jgi:hypothetical protein
MLRFAEAATTLRQRSSHCKSSVIPLRALLFPWISLSSICHPLRAFSVIAQAFRSSCGCRFSGILTGLPFALRLPGTGAGVPSQPLLGTSIKAGTISSLQCQRRAISQLERRRGAIPSKMIRLREPVRPEEESQSQPNKNNQTSSYPRRVLLN